MLTVIILLLCSLCYLSTGGIITSSNNNNLTKKFLSLAFSASVFIASNTHSVNAIGLFGQNSIYETANDIPSNILKEKKEINGRVISISDGDTYRIRHLPSGIAGILSGNSEKFDGPLKYHTIVVRIYAVDTPEIKKFGNPGQPYGEEAKQFAMDKLLNQKVVLKCLTRDRYGRLLAVVKYKDGMLSNEKDISEELLRHGLAVVYRSGGASYDGKGVKYFDEIENIAKKNKKGLWSRKSKDIELPSEYKKKINDKTSKKSKAKRDMASASMSESL